MNIKNEFLFYKWLAGVVHTLLPLSVLPSNRQLKLLSQNVDILDEKDENEQMVAEKRQIMALLQIMHVRTTAWAYTTDETHLPALVLLPGYGWGIVTGVNVKGTWIIELPRKQLSLEKLPDGTLYAPLAMLPESDSAKSGSAKYLFRRIIMGHKKFFIWAAVATFTGNIMALAGSLYSMQVYDRVLPTENDSTLIVLMIGALLAAFTEFVIKIGKHGVTEYATRAIDITLSGRIYRRLLHVRLDQYPPSLGTLSSQIRGFETVRVFMTTAIMFFLIDAPFALIFLAAIGFLGGPLVAAVPLFFMLLSLSVGLYYRNRISAHASTGNDNTNRRQGMLVETIQNAELIKASGTGDLFSSRWHVIEQHCADNNMQIKHYSEHANYFTAFIQQSAYITMVSVGAWVAITQNSLTSGALIACSILSGRVLAPVAMLPGLIVQWAHSRAAMEGLENIFALESDNQGVDRPLSPEKINGEYMLSGISFAWPGGPETLKIPRLHIRAGERVAILGSVGTGKSSLLRLLAGLYQPTSGTVLLDGLDIQQVNRTHLSERVGYFSQETRLFAGPLRDSIMAGVYDVNEERLIDACRQTGLDRVVASHPRGFSLEISEGGNGLSGGQKQQVALTRMLLAAPDVWLLDEPTSSMDDMTEGRCLQALNKAIETGKTLVLITHKPALLALVNRVIILGPQGIVADGPKDTILQPRVARSSNVPTNKDSPNEPYASGGKLGSEGERS